jgi:DNA-binding transcriptional regulator PaaX
MTASYGRIGALIMRIQGDYLEEPGLTLTFGDAQRRFGADEITCEAVLAALVEAGVLTKTREGAYARFFPRLVPRVRAGRESGPRQGGTSRFAEHAA